MLEILTQASLVYSTLSIHIRSAEIISEDSSFHSRSIQHISRLLFLSSHLIQPEQSLFQTIIPTVFLLVGLNPQVFPRILPDSSNFSRSYSQILSKFDVRMDSISHIPLQDLFQILFKFGSTFLFFIILEYLINSSWWLSSSISALKTEEEFLLNPYPFS